MISKEKVLFKGSNAGEGTPLEIVARENGGQIVFQIHASENASFSVTAYARLCKSLPWAPIAVLNNATLEMTSSVYFDGIYSASTGACTEFKVIVNLLEDGDLTIIGKVIT